MKKYIFSLFLASSLVIASSYAYADRAFFGGTAQFLQLANNVYLQARNAANSAWQDVLKVDTSNNTILNAPTSQSIGLAVNNVTQLGVSATNLSFRDGWTVNNSNQLIQSTAGGAIALNSTTQSHLLTGSASGQLRFYGSNSSLTSSGANIAVAGVSHATTGQIQFNAGAVSGGHIINRLGHSSALVKFQNDVGTDVAQVNNNGDLQYVTAFAATRYPILSQVAAGGSTYADATPLTGILNRVMTSGASQGVSLTSTMPVGAEIRILNQGGNPLYIYPLTGTNLQGKANDVGFQISANQMASCIILDVTGTTAMCGEISIAS